MRPHSRKNSGYNQYVPPQPLPPQQEQMFMAQQMAPPQMMYHQQMDHQFAYPPQFGMVGPYQNSPMMNAPPTPFDSSYGATLLPSHLLMGSPYLNSPKMKFPQQQQQLPPQVPPSQQQIHQTQSQLQSFKFTGHDGKQQQQQQRFHARTLSADIRRNSRQPSGLSQVHLAGDSTAAAEANDEERIAYMRSLFARPFSIAFKILPKGDDVYRTRSLLFENIDKSIDIHSFVANYVKENAIESVYLVDHSAIVQMQDKQQQQVQSEPDTEKQSILLSFFTRQQCLNFYNSVLQRLKEFKKNLKSESLRLSFVSLNYVPYVPEAAEDTANSSEKDVDTTVNSSTTRNGDSSFMSTLQNEIIPIDATRSIAVEFNDTGLSKDDIINKKLAFLNTGNKRYILESIFFVKTDEAHEDFSENYAILTFLNIPMANEVLNWLDTQLEQLGIRDCFFVSITPQRERSSRTSESSKNSDSANTTTSKKNSISGASSVMNNNMHSSSVISLQSSDSNLSLPNRGDISTLREYRMTVDRDDYSEPFTKEYKEHLSNIALSQASQTDMQMTPAMNQEMFLNDMGPMPGMSPAFGGVETFGIDQQSAFVPSVISRNGSFIDQGPMMAQSYYLEQQQHYRMNSNIHHPITDSLENQMNASAKIASAMGSDAGNRTVYIGNINARSKPEDICNVVRGGILQSIRFIEAKHICFVTFIEAAAAVQFYANAFIDPIVLHGNTLKLGWGNYSGPLPKSIALAVTVGGSRNVYVSLPDVAFKDKFISNPEYQKFHEQYKLPSPEQLRKDFSTYGAIEQINYMKDSHCCWVNFMNISSAIKLVEEANSKTNKMEEKFDGRYQGLVINYGKDRCGNVNRNLVAGKNSRFYNKVKRPSYDIRLSKLEEKRKYKESKRREADITQSFVESSPSKAAAAEEKEETRLNLESLGITLNTEESAVNSTGIMEKIDETEGEEAQPSTILDSFLTGESTKQEDSSKLDNTPKKDDIANISSSSSDIEFIIKPTDKIEESSNMAFNDSMISTEDLTNHAIKTTIMNSNVPAISKQALEFEPPFAPDTISRDYAMQFGDMSISHQPQPQMGWADESENINDNSRSYNNSNYNNRGNNGNQRKQRGGNQKNKNKNKNTRTIPGSDVMAQYLAQLQHSTFMYAANVLGASADDPELYEE